MAQIDNADRIHNRIPAENETDMTLLNANKVMAILDKIVNGSYRQKDKIWTTATRPSPSDPIPVEVGEKGWNTTINGPESYTGSVYGWQVHNGAWTDENRPPTTNLCPGSRGYNITRDTNEYWSGAEWRAS